MWNVLAACWLRRWNVNRKGKLGLLSYLVCVSRGDNVCRAAVHFFPLFLERMNVWRRNVLIIGWSLLADQKERKKKVWFGRKQKREPFGPRGKVVRPGLRVSRYTVEAINRFFILFGRYNNIPPPRREWSVRSNQESVTDDWYLTVMTKWLMCLSPSTKPGHPLSFPLWFHTHLVLLPCLALSSASDPELMVGRNTSGRFNGFISLLLPHSNLTPEGISNYFSIEKESRSEGTQIFRNVFLGEFRTL